MKLDLAKLPLETKVRIVDKWREGSSFNSEEKMDKYLGNILTIERDYHDGEYACYEDAREWIWEYTMFQAIRLPYTDNWLKINDEDIKNGYIEITGKGEPKFLTQEELDSLLEVAEDLNVTSEKESEYFVFVSGKAAPKVRHSSLIDAEKEAQRLANIEVGKVVSICKIEKQFIGKVIVEEV